ncbi:MAG: class I SAM-dependent methyltransferase, partial [Nitrososphaerota archaeon]
DAFKITTINYKEKWNKRQIDRIRKKIQFLLNNEEDWAQPIDENSPVNRYRFISKFIEKNDVVLDIACGKGGGSIILSEVAKQVYGIDYNLNYISYAKSKFKKNNLEFIHGTDEFLEKMQSKFDKVVSAHTMEHVDDDEIFLKRIKKSLKKDGKLILDVPRFFPYPLGIPLWPVHKREYSKESLENILNKTGFEVEASYGINRRNYVNVENARDSFLYVCKNKN